MTTKPPLPPNALQSGVGGAATTAVGSLTLPVLYMIGEAPSKVDRAVFQAMLPPSEAPSAVSVDENKFPLLAVWFKHMAMSHRQGEMQE